MLYNIALQPSPMFPERFLYAGSSRDIDHTPSINLSTLGSQRDYLVHQIHWHTDNTIFVCYHIVSRLNYDRLEGILHRL